MDTLVVFPSDFTPPRAFLRELGDRGRIRFAGPMVRHDTRSYDLAFRDGLRTYIIVCDPRALRAQWLGEVLQAWELHRQEWSSLAFVPRQEVGRSLQAVLASPGAVVAFEAQDVHRAGGFDTEHSIVGMCLDMQWRLNARSHHVGRVVARRVVSSPVPSAMDYLTVLTKNVSSDRLSSLLAPLFSAAVVGPLRGHEVDCTALDLERSPAGDDISTLEVPSQALAGAQLLRDWGASLGQLRSAAEIVQRHRRVPDSRLPHFDDVVDQLWHVLGIDPEQRELLEVAFTEGRSSSPVDVIVVAHSDDEAARRRLNALVSQGLQSVCWWDPDDMRMRSWSDGEWVGSEEALTTWEASVAVIVFMNAWLRELPGATRSDAVVIIDLVTSNVGSRLSGEFVGDLGDDLGIGSTAALADESFARADRFIVRSEPDRDWMLGYISGLHRLDIVVYEEDHSLENLVAIDMSDEDCRELLRTIRYPRRSLDLVATSGPSDREPFDELRKQRMGIGRRTLERGSGVVETLAGGI